MLLRYVLFLMTNHLMSSTSFLHQCEQNKAYLDIKVILVLKKDTKSSQNHPEIDLNSKSQFTIQTHCNILNFANEYNFFNSIIF